MRQFTTDGRYKSRPVTDGTRPYFLVSRLRGSRDEALAQVAVSGGERSSSHRRPARHQRHRFRRHPTAGECGPSRTGRRTAGGYARARGESATIGGSQVMARADMGAAWSADMSTVAYVNGAELGLAGRDGTGARKPVRASGRAQLPRWSPDGMAASVSLQRATRPAPSIWEVQSDGSGVASCSRGGREQTIRTAAAGRPTAATIVFEASGTSGHSANPVSCVGRQNRCSSRSAP